MVSKCNQLAVRRRGWNHDKTPATEQPQVPNCRSHAQIVWPGSRPGCACALEQVQAAAAAAAAVSAPAELWRNYG